MRKLLIAVVAVAGILLAALLVVPGLIDWTEYKPQIRDAVREATGRDLVIDGDIRLSVIPSPTLSVADLRLANIEGGSQPSMASLDFLDVRIALLPLLSGTLQVKSVTLVRPVVMLETLPDGRDNWRFETASTPIPSAAGERPAQAGSGAAPFGGTFALDRAQVEDGALVYRDGVSGREYALSGLDMTVSAGGLSGPFTLDGRVDYRGIPLALSASLGEIDSGRAARLKLDIAAGDGVAMLALSGVLGLENGPSFRGKLDVEAPRLDRAAALASSLGVAIPPGLPANAISLEAALEGTMRAVTARDLAVVLNGARFQGRAALTLDSRPDLELVLTGNRLDLDALLSAGGDRPGTRAVPAVRAPATSPEEETPQSGPATGLPRNFDARLDLKIDAVRFKGASLRNARLEASLRNGIVDLRLATARLPGGTDITVIGGVENTLPPVFKGRVEAVSDNLRPTLEWLDLDLTDISADRLRKATLSAAVEASGTELRMTDWSMELDTIRARGGLTLALRDRPAFGLRLDVDRVDLDAYRIASATPQTGEPDGSATDRPAGSDAPSPLAMLEGFDANVDLRVGEAIFQGIALSDARLDALLQDGTLTLRTLRVADWAGVRGSVSGVVERAARDPSVDLSLDIAIEDVERLSRVAAVDLPVALSALGAPGLSGTVAGNPGDFAVDLVLAAAGGSLDLAGSVRPVAVAPALDLSYALSHPDAGRLVAMLSAGAGPALAKLGPLSSRGTVKSVENGSYALSVSAALSGGEVTLSGLVEAFAPDPVLGLDVAARHPGAVELIRVFAPDYRTRAKDPGALRLAARIDGPLSRLVVDDLSLTLGKVSAAGTGTIALVEPRPSIALDLRAGRIDLDPWLPAEQPIPQGAVLGGAVPVGRGEWSRNRIDFASLSSLDADIRTEADALVFGDYVVEDAAMAAAIKDGVLSVSRLSGGMFGGAFEVTAMLADRPVPEAAVSVRVRNADIRRAAATAGSGIRDDMVSGVLSYETALSARGVSQYDMVSSLAGNGAFEIRDGAVQGFDLRSFSERLKDLNGVEDFLDLTQRALLGGQTSFRSLSGSYAVSQGVLRSSDIALDAEAASGQAGAVIDLPPRQIDVNATARLSGHPNAPPVGVRLVGLLDNPRRILDINEMQRHIVRRIGTRTLRQLERSGTLDRLLGPGGEAEGVTEDTEPAQPVRPEDAVRGLLKGILNR